MASIRPRHGHDVPDWLLMGCKQAFQKWSLAGYLTTINKLDTTLWLLTGLLAASGWPIYTIQWPYRGHIEAIAIVPNWESQFPLTCIFYTGRSVMWVRGLRDGMGVGTWRHGGRG